MAAATLRQICLELLFASGIVSLDCSQIAQSQKSENGKTMKLLKALGGRQQPLPECLTRSFGFPLQQLLQASKEDARRAIGLILEEILDVFQLNFTQAEWNMSDTDLLQKALFQQVMQWKGCSVEEKGDPSTFKDRRLRLRLKKYFLGIHRFLTEEEFSFCAWEAVRMDILRSGMLVYH
uniref:Uncharacterized protein n=1 Tax=Varanus komodoensis TaxID=61221 RepID=A0A8D2LIU7_VARKO